MVRVLTVLVIAALSHAYIHCNESFSSRKAQNFVSLKICKTQSSLSQFNLIYFVSSQGAAIAQW